MFNFSRLRAPIRGRVAFAVSLPKAEFRPPFRRFSAEPPKPKKSSAPIWLAGAAVGGIAYYYYTTQIATNSGITVKPKAVFKPAKEDYQKVCVSNFAYFLEFNLTRTQKVYNKIAEIFDQAGEYDGVNDSLV